MSHKSGNVLEWYILKNNDLYLTHCSSQSGIIAGERINILLLTKYIFVSEYSKNNVNPELEFYYESNEVNFSDQQPVIRITTHLELSRIPPKGESIRS